MKEDIEAIKNRIVPILKKYNVKKAGLFGSIIRDDYKKDSDIDILVEIEDNISLFDFIGIKLEIEEEIGRKIDMIEYSVIKPAIKEKILNEQVLIL